jgi:hypothetical protein
MAIVTISNLWGSNWRRRRNGDKKGTNLHTCYLYGVSYRFIESVGVEYNMMALVSNYHLPFTSSTFVSLAMVVTYYSFRKTEQARHRLALPMMKMEGSLVPAHNMICKPWDQLALPLMGDFKNVPS